VTRPEVRPQSDPMADGIADLRASLLAVIRSKGYERRTEPFQLSSGQWSHDYVDAKRAVAAGPDLVLAARAIVALAASRWAEFDAVGGLTMGADAFAHAVAVATGSRWFSVRKEAKRHGRQRLIEGAELRAGDRILVVDDVVTTGASIGKAVDAVDEAGARVVLATTLLDRGEATSRLMAGRGVPYEPLLTYRDLGIDPVDG
jgi:orotate phosphoribosyltransferase